MTEIVENACSPESACLEALDTASKMHFRSEWRLKIGI